MITSFKISIQAATALLAMFAAVLLLAAMPSPAAALSWSLPATDLSDGPANNASRSQVAVAADGATIVVWSRSNGSHTIIQARTRRAGSGTFSAAINLSAAGQDASNPQVAMAANGATAVIWTRSDGSNSIVQTRTRPAGSAAFGVLESLSVVGQNALGVQVAIGTDGATTVVWSRSDGSNLIVQARTRPAGSVTFAAAVNLSAVGRHAYYPQLAVAADGATTVVWYRSNGVHLIVQARTRPAGSVIFAAAVNLSAAGQYADSVRVAVAADGATTVAWRRSNSINYIIQARTRPAGSVTFAAVVSLSDPGQDAFSLQLAVASDGVTTVIWTRSNSSNSIVQARTRPAGSVIFAGVVSLSAAGQHAYQPQLAVAADGTTTVVWIRNNGSHNITQARTRPAGSVTFAGAVNLSAAGQDAAWPRVAVAIDGTTTVVWQQSGPAYQRIQESTSQTSMTVTKSGTGSGTASSNPAGIDCGLICNYSFGLSTSVTLTASPAAGSSFAGWSGSGCSGTSTCTVTMSAARAVTTEFALLPPGFFNLAVSKSGTGGGTVTSSPAGINCGADCSEILADGSSVTLTATPAAGSSFTGWNGSGCSGTSTCTVTISAARAVDAKFMPSNRFTMRSIKAGRKAVISVFALPGRGELTQIITRKRSSRSSARLTVCKTSRKATQAGRVKLTCKLNSATRKALRKRSLRVSMKTTFKPTGGLTASKTQAVTLKRKR